MFSSLEVRGFRSFARMRAEQLTRVNLLVGPNNAGKTSLLEAVEALSIGNIGGLLRGPQRRGEFLPGRDAEEVAVAHLFRDHNAGQGARFEVVADGDPSARLTAEIVPHPSDPDEPDRADGLALELMSSRSSRRQVQELSESGGVPLSQRVSLKPSGFGPDSVAFVRVGHWDAETAATLWDEVVLTQEQVILTAALRALEPSLEDVAFTTGGNRVAAWMKLAGVADKVPLGAAGDGMSRFLALGLHLVASGGSVFLVDDIDTGLHHSAMERLWIFVIEASRRLDRQVFATTHSLDCVQALARVSERSGSSNVASLHRIERGASNTVRYSADEVAIAAQHHLEVR